MQLRSWKQTSHEKCHAKLKNFFKLSEVTDGKLDRLQSEFDLLLTEMVILLDYKPGENQIDLASECIANQLRKIITIRRDLCWDLTCCNHKRITAKDCDCKPEEMKLYKR